ncbi:MAG: hypothetical protein ACAI38_09820 [Myxococcota bacterium]
MLPSLFTALLLSLGCIDEPIDGFPGVVVTSAFAHDAGCVLSHYTVDGKKYEDFTHVLPALTKAGWADRKKRTAIALTWMQAVSEENLENLKAKLEDDGGVRLDATYKPRSGMRERPPEERAVLKVRISPDGVLGPVKDAK